MVFGGNPSDLVTLFEDHMNMEEEARKSGNGKMWTWEQDKAFENALVMYSEDCSDRWERIAGDVDGKDVGDVKEHYGLLEEDIDAIEGGRVPIPSYGDGGDNMGENMRNGKTGKGLQERRKGTAWSEEEHRLFLLGLKKYGKGDWRSISRHFVISRSATQVASHAQKYFMRLESGTKDKRRTSIHDITTVNEEDDQGPITGQLDQPSSGSLPIPPNCLNTMQESHPRLKSGNKKRNTSSHI